MDAPPLPSERRRELAALRSRAYGPDADINGDADALARLIELEDLARADGAPDVAPARAESAPTHGLRAGTDRETATAVVTDESSTASEVTAPRAGWRRVPLWAYILCALALGIIIGAMVPSLFSPHPVTTLQQVPIEGKPLDFQMYGVRAASPVRYESFHDLEVWSARTTQGSTCIVVANDAGEWVATGCAPEPLTPSADVVFYEGMRPIDGLDLPDGSLLRFVLREDVMEIWIAETAQPA